MRMFFSLAAVTLLAVAVSADATASTVNESNTPEATGGAEAGATSPDARKLSEALIYSVDRTPESPFDTPRAVEVITIDDIRRKSGMSLSDVLVEVSGLFIQQTNFSGGAPIIRGQMGKQVLILIDGVKLNNSTWRAASKEYLNIIDLDQVERIEVVRGVVSVLGTESLGGVINVISRKGPATEGFGGSIGARYSSADNAFATPVLFHGSGKSYRFFGGTSYHSAGELTAGGDIGEQALSSYNEKSLFGNLQYFLSADRTVSVSYQSHRQDDIDRPNTIFAEQVNQEFKESISFDLGSVSYQDLTSRIWADSAKATVYWNEQFDGKREIRLEDTTMRVVLDDTDSMWGASFEFGKFLGPHHLVYGLDYSRDSISSKRRDERVGTDQIINASARGRYTDGAKYETYGIYLNDKFNLTRFATISAGVRYGSFAASGSEQTSVGNITIDSENSDFTGSLNGSFHITPSLNLVAGVIRGFRAPNIDDISKYNERSSGVEVPNPAVGPEHVDSLELGFKFERSTAGLSGFYYRNDLKDLLVRTTGTLNGADYFDRNHNGKKDKGEAILLSKNIGEAQIRGIELAGHYSPIPRLYFFANYNYTIGDDLTTGEPLSRIPPIFGTAGARWSSFEGRHPWLELTYQYAGKQQRLNAADRIDTRIGLNGTAPFDVLNLRGGLSITERFRVNAGIENITDEAYKYHGSYPYHAGRQLVLGTEFKF